MAWDLGGREGGKIFISASISQGLFEISRLLDYDSQPC